MSKNNPKSTSIHVCVNIRPLLPKENGLGGKSVFCNDGCNVEIASKTGSKQIFGFDRAFDEQNSKVVFSKEIKPRLDATLNGINLSIMAYGQTGAGKTYLMQGTESAIGIIPQSVQYLIQLCSSPDASLAMSYVEIYNEKVYDLLDPKPNELKVLEDANRNVVVSGLAKKPIKTAHEFDLLYKQGCKNRTTAATLTNATSSRSHAIVLLSVTRRCGQKNLSSKVFLCDLAGSENNNLTGNTGVRMTESSNINQSLFCLSKVVNCLNARNLNPTQRVPYRDSKLTRLLQDSLGGSASSVLFACLAPSAAQRSETLSTLAFAAKSKKIVNTVRRNEFAVQTTAAPINTAEERKRKLAEWRAKKAGGSNKRPLGNNNARNSNGKNSSQKASKKPRLALSLDKENANSGVAAELSACAQQLARPDLSATMRQRLQDRVTLLTSQLVNGPSRRQTSSRTAAKAARQAGFGRAQLVGGNEEDADSEFELDVEDEAIAMESDDDEQKPAAKRVIEPEMETSALTHDSAERARVVLMILNSGNMKQLQSLKTVGKKRAQVIFESRAGHQFESVADLEGIHSSLTRKICDSIWRANVLQE